MNILLYDIHGRVVSRDELSDFDNCSESKQGKWTPVFNQLLTAGRNSEKNSFRSTPAITQGMRRSWTSRPNPRAGIGLEGLALAGRAETEVAPTPVHFIPEKVSMKSIRNKVSILTPRQELLLTARENSGQSQEDNKLPHYEKNRRIGKANFHQGIIEEKGKKHNSPEKLVANKTMSRKYNNFDTLPRHSTSLQLKETMANTSSSPPNGTYQNETPICGSFEGIGSKDLALDALTSIAVHPGSRDSEGERGWQKNNCKHISRENLQDISERAGEIGCPSYGDNSMPVPTYQLEQGDVHFPTLASYGGVKCNERSISVPHVVFKDIQPDRSDTVTSIPCDKTRNKSISSEPGRDVLHTLHKRHTFHGQAPPQQKHDKTAQPQASGKHQKPEVHSKVTNKHDGESQGSVDNRKPILTHQHENFKRFTHPDVGQGSDYDRRQVDGSDHGNYGMNHAGQTPRRSQPLSPLDGDPIVHRLPQAMRHARLNQHILESGPDPEFMAQFRHLEPLLRFRRVVKTVITLLKATTSSRRDQQRSQAKLLSFTQFKDELLNSRRQFYGTDLSFDPQIFKAHRECTISNEAKTILSMEPHERTEEQLHVAHLSLQQAVEAFGEFPINMQQSLVRVGWYEHFESKRVIIRQGHTADNFYFILSGTALVTILETKKDGDTYVRTAAMLGKGNSFGELALMHGAKRSATVTCKDDVELLAVGREDFIDIFMRVEKNKEPEHIRYLRTLDLLHGWPLEKVPYDNPKICLFTYFRRGVVMCRDSNNSDWVYLIKSGSCRVLKTLTATKPDVPGLELQEYKPESSESKGGGLPSSRRSKEKNNIKPDPSITNHVASTHGSTPRREKDLIIAKGLPPIRTRSNTEIREIEEDHKKRLEEVFREKHQHQYPEDQYRGRVRFVQSYKNDGHEDKVFVQIQKLGPRDTFGFEHIAFSMMEKCTSVSLVSDGAEAVLISKKFFLQHLSDEMQKKLRCTIQPYPAEDALQQKLQDKTNWEAFKTMTVNSHVGFTRYVHDTLYL